MNLDLLRTYFAVLDAGSINRAAACTHAAQSTLTRQIQALEGMVGGSLLERGPNGVRSTPTGDRLRERLEPLLKQLDAELDDVRRFANGQRESLRIGYVASAASRFFNPALSVLRAKHPEMKIQLHDLSPGEQIDLLRTGGLDVGLMGNISHVLGDDFYVRRIATLGVCVAFPEGSAPPEGVELQLRDLRSYAFIGADERDLPGHNQWIRRLCKKSGFDPRFAIIAESLAHGLAAVVSENAVMLVPDYLAATPGVALRPLHDEVRWEMCLAWQRGKVAAPVRTLLESLTNRDKADPTPTSGATTPIAP